MEVVLQRKVNNRRMNVIFVLLILTIICVWYFQTCRVPIEVTGFAGFSRVITDELPVSTEGTFSVITYNVAGLPQLICSAVTERTTSITEIGRRLNSYDIVHVQEDFNYNSFLYKSNEHPYKTKTKGKVPFGDGLNTLSKFPIITLHRVPWKNCSGADCLTPKGFTYSRIEVAKNIYIDFYNVHANSADDPGAAAARRKNIKQLSYYIKQHSEGNAVIVMGDLNAHFCYEHDNIRDLLADNDLQDAWVELKSNNNLPVFRAFAKENILELNDDCESIDKILYRSNLQLKLTPSNYRYEYGTFNNEQGFPLSDHCPVSLVFNWKLIPQH
ncbi:endonuclease/exonuclease/phosphatase family protein [Olivibacter sp. SDN3]|uniref:endonuclease/exonuclease/phosphatase family protein n=1 Tax=Olivibacter sp. SDN3 TaxID=2764720 RepID=UPI0016519E09|nr:endonuclease/exonuclease/phosphatase family protein [Olivibacter sp. SDN3]QNL49465.1 endonuclease/exonuclease/phosphatase family protein [Olivibacter sp. SDN3]